MARHVTQYFAEPATDDQIARVAPSVFTTSPHSSRSERFAQITTADILRGLRGEGWGVYSAGQTRATEGRRDYTKHMLRLRRDGAKFSDSDGVPELVLLNAHDGTSSYKLMGGYFRWACLNGMIAGDICSTVRVGHTGNAVERVVRGSFEVLDGLTRVIESRDEMRAVALTGEEQHVLATAALQLPWDEGKAPVKAEQLLTPRRWADRGDDLWTVFNRLQENVVRGGVAGRTATGRNTRTRGVAAIDKNVAVNRALWALAEGMKAIKTGRAEELVAA